jgi:hypothetical protein
MVNFGLCNALAVFSNIDSINKHEQYDWTSNFLRSIEIVADNSYYDDEYDNHYNNHPSVSELRCSIKLELTCTSYIRFDVEQKKAQ